MPILNFCQFLMEIDFTNNLFQNEFNVAVLIEKSVNSESSSVDYRLSFRII